MSEELKPCPFCGAGLIEAHSFASRSSKTFVHPVIESADGSDAACPGNHLIVNTGRPESIAAWNRRATPPDMREAVEALRRADRFITNGIELGYIRMPDAGTPDPAHETPSIVRAAIRSLTGAKP